MATATVEHARTDRHHLAAGRGASRGLRVPAAAGAAGQPSPARRPAPPTATSDRAATRSGVRAQARRQRAGLALLVIVVVLVALLIRAGAPAGASVDGITMGSASAAGAWSTSAAVVGGGVLVVGPGETVWDLVAPHLPAGTDMGAYVAEVLRHNDLHATAVTPGTVVRLP